MMTREQARARLSAQLDAAFAPVMQRTEAALDDRGATEDERAAVMAEQRELCREQRARLLEIGMRLAEDPFTAVSTEAH